MNMICTAASRAFEHGMSDHLKEVPPAARLLGREIVSVDPASGEVKLRFTATAEFANRHGTVQGGMLAAMLDSATGNAIMARLPPHLTAVTIRLDTQFLKPAALGIITATARLIRLDERSAEVQAELSDSEGRVVATARAELRVRERKK
jgi:uncharacterized protein (TIGR00369 family)